MTRRLACLVPGLLAGAPVFAQTPPVVVMNDLVAQAETTRAHAAATAEAWREWGDDLRASLSTMFGDRLGARTVKGAPYSADVTTENNQPLADGNVISKKTTGRVYRDGDGRTRQETLVDGSAKSIQISDPVEKKSVMLLPGSKKAVNMPFAFAGRADRKELKIVRVGGKEVRVEDGRITIDGKEVRANVEIEAGGKTIRVENGKVTIDGKELKGPVAAAPGASRETVVETETKDGVQRETVRVQVVHAGDSEGGRNFSWNLAPLAPLPPIPPIPPSPGFAGAASKSKSATSSLGQKEFDGVRAEGTLREQVIPAGEIGNRSPITITTETWTSPELQVTVYSRHNDPRRGETIYRLTNIRRAEPAADLFKVPEEYAASRRSRG
jgi:hypothetical protein